MGGEGRSLSGSGAGEMSVRRKGGTEGGWSRA